MNSFRCDIVCTQQTSKAESELRCRKTLSRPGTQDVVGVIDKEQDAFLSEQLFLVQTQLLTVLLFNAGCGPEGQ